MIAEYYSPSGKFSPMAFVYFFLISLVAFPVIGLIYAYATWYIPFIYINFLLTAGFGFAVGFLVSTVVVRMGKVRNTILACALGFTGAIIALYFHWAVWVDLLFNAGESYGTEKIGVTVSNIQIFQVFGLAFNPGVLFDLIGQINEFGTWSMFGIEVSGILLSIVWLIEFIIMVGVATFMAGSPAGLPFSETNETWFESQDLHPFNYLDKPEEILSHIENSDLNAFESIARVENIADDHSVFTLYSADGEVKSYLSIENKIATTDKDGKLIYEEENVVALISLNSQMTQALLAK